MEGGGAAEAECRPLGGECFISEREGEGERDRERNERRLHAPLDVGLVNEGSGCHASVHQQGALKALAQRGDGQSEICVRSSQCEIEMRHRGNDFSL